MIRLDNKFIYKDKSKYYLTEITNLSEWKDMSDSDKKKNWFKIINYIR